MVKLLLLILLLISFSGSANKKVEPRVLKLAAAEWCPYVCENSKLGKGIVYDYLSMILKPQGIVLELTFLPWTDAINSAIAGKHHGLIGAIKSEAPELNFTNTPTMHYKMCLFNSKDDPWQYEGKSSLSGKTFGLIEGYGYGEPLDSYFRDPKNAKDIKVLPGDNGLARLNLLLADKQFEVFAEDGYVVKWQSRDIKYSHFKQAGCLRPVPFYMAFNPDFAQSSKIIATIDTELSDPKYKSYLNKYMLPHYFSSSSSNWEK